MPASPRLIAGLSSSASAGPIGCTSGRCALDFGALSPGFFGEVGVFAMPGIWDESAAEKRATARSGTGGSTVRCIVSSCQYVSSHPVMRGLDRRIHVLLSLEGRKDVDGRAKPGHDKKRLQDPHARHQSQGRPARRAVDARQYSAAGDGLFRGQARSQNCHAAGRVRHLRPSRLGAQRRLQRGAYSGDQPGAVRSPGESRLLRPSVHRHRHPCAGRARARQRAGSVRRQRRRGDDRCAGRLYADAGDLARDPHLQ